MSGLTARVHLDPNGKDLTIEHVQDVEAILEWNAQSRAEEQRSDWGRHVARIPNVIYVKWLDDEHRKGNTNLRLFSHEFNQIVRKKLQDPEWFHLRTDRPALQAGWSKDHA
jgi:hypothetical protein